MLGGVGKRGSPGHGISLPPVGTGGAKGGGVLNDFSAGFFIGLLVGEGHFGGDGKQPQVTLRMHVRHETLFHWLLGQVPGSKLYGPYSHGGRQYYQWMARGEVLKKSLVPLIDSLPLDQLDRYMQERYQQMKERYKL